MTEIKMIKFKIEDTPLFVKKLDINETLSSISNIIYKNQKNLKTSSKKKMKKKV